MAKQLFAILQKGKTYTIKSKQFQLGVPTPVTKEEAAVLRTKKMVYSVQHGNEKKNMEEDRFSFEERDVADAPEPTDDVPTNDNPPPQPPAVTRGRVQPNTTAQTPGTAPGNTPNSTAE